MPVWIVENTEHGNVSYSNFNEGLGKVLRYGANSAEVIDRLTAQVEAIGLTAEVGDVRLRWFEPSIELDSLRIVAEDGTTALAADALRVVFRPFGPAPFIDRVEVADGEVTWDKERWS